MSSQDKRRPRPAQASSRFAVDELVHCLFRLPMVRRQATLYALEAGFTPGEVVELTWATVLQRNEASGLARDILRERNRCRHIRLAYVFWEQSSPIVAGPLFALQKSIELAFGQPWPSVREAYRTLLMIDRTEEARAFMSEFSRYRQDIS